MHPGRPPRKGEVWRYEGFFGKNKEYEVIDYDGRHYALKEVESGQVFYYYPSYAFTNNYWTLVSGQSSQVYKPKYKLVDRGSYYATEKK